MGGGHSREAVRVSGRGLAAMAVGERYIPGSSAPTQQYRVPCMSLWQEDGMEGGHGCVCVSEGGLAAMAVGVV